MILEHGKLQLTPFGKKAYDMAVNVAVELNLPQNKILLTNFNNIVNYILTSLVEKKKKTVVGYFEKYILFDPHSVVLESLSSVFELSNWKFLH